MELENISSKYIALMECKRCEIKSTKDLDKRMLKKNFEDTSRYSGALSNFV